MATLVSFHAHPDDEAIATGGTMAKAAAAGHRVVLVTATDGAVGEVPDGFLAEGERLEDRRLAELQEAGKILGASRVECLGYRDSGMRGTADNDDPRCFWRADLEEAAERLARILREEDADVLTVYDDHGGYDHPDHVQVHRVGLRAAELARTPRVYESTMDRDHIKELMASDPAPDAPDSPGRSDSDFDLDSFGTPAALITTRVDVRDYLEQKRAAMVAHASQIAEDSFFLAMPPEAFAAAFGTEVYIRRDVAPPHVETDLFEGLG